MVGSIFGSAPFRYAFFYSGSHSMWHPVARGMLLRYWPSIVSQYMVQMVQATSRPNIGPISLYQKWINIKVWGNGYYSLYKHLIICGMAVTVVLFIDPPGHTLEEKCSQVAYFYVIHFWLY